MQNNLSSQASPDISPEGVINAVLGRFAELKVGKQRFGHSNPPLNGRISATGGAYGEMSGRMFVRDKSCGQSMIQTTEEEES